MKIVTIGGGTGGYVVDKGLSAYDIELTSITTPFDAGGSAGKLKDEFGTLPQGDIRRRILAQSKEDTSVLRELFAYRFDHSSSLSDHSLGNLMLTASVQLFGEQDGIDKVSKLFNVSGRIVPASYDKAELCAILSDGHILKNEKEIDLRDKSDTRKISNIFLSNKCYLSSGAGSAIRSADIIVIAPGDLYTSILPNFLVTGMNEAFKESHAKLIYVMNIMSKRSETHTFTGEKFLSELYNYSGIVPDVILCNNTALSPELIEKYATKDDSHPVLVRDTNNKYVFVDLLNDDINTSGLIRHDSRKLAKAVLDVALMFN